MARRIIRCQAAPGFDGCFRAGRKWPARGIEVEITSDQDDVEAKDGQPLKIGQKTFEALQGDTRFSFGIAGTLEEADELKARVTELEAENAELKAKLAEATAHGDDASKAKGKGGK